MEAVAHVNHLAERSPGFIWRYRTSDGDLSGRDLLDDALIIINLSVWQNYEYLHAFTYRSAHGHYVRRRAEWFTPLPSSTTALWWIAADAQPTPLEAIARLQHLRRARPSPQAFTARRRFDPNGRPDPRPRRARASAPPSDASTCQN